jgi:hypothetical protein
MKLCEAWEKKDVLTWKMQDILLISEDDKGKNKRSKEINSLQYQTFQFKIC